MSRVVLEAQTTTALERITVHGQYNNQALGFFLLNNLVPITVNVRLPGPSYKQVIVVFGPKNHKYSPYADLGLMEKCCKKVYTFNIRHYVKCYLNAPNPEPFTYNLCQVCGASVTDDKGHTIQSIVKRSYRADKFVWRAKDALQAATGKEPVFTHHEGVL